jgi:hypothetical protein
MQIEQQDIQAILKLLNEQTVTIARMDERQIAMQNDISAFRVEITRLGTKVQNVENTAFRNAVITGFVGAGMGSVATMIASKLLG